MDPISGFPLRFIVLHDFTPLKEQYLKKLLEFHRRVSLVELSHQDTSPCTKLDVAKSFHDILNHKTSNDKVGLLINIQEITLNMLDICRQLSITQSILITDNEIKNNGEDASKNENTWRSVIGSIAGKIKSEILQYEDVFGSPIRTVSQIWRCLNLPPLNLQQIQKFETFIEDSSLTISIPRTSRAKSLLTDDNRSENSFDINCNTMNHSKSSLQFIMNESLCSSQLTSSDWWPSPEPFPAIGTWKYRVAEPFFHTHSFDTVTSSLATRNLSSASTPTLQMQIALKDYFGLPVAQPCCNGFAALVLALQCGGLERGQYVLIPTFTMVAVANAVHFCGGIPVFVDNAPGCYNPGREQYEAAATAILSSSTSTSRLTVNNSTVPPTQIPVEEENMSTEASRDLCDRVIFGIVVCHTYGIAAEDIFAIRDLCQGNYCEGKLGKEDDQELNFLPIPDLSLHTAQSAPPSRSHSYHLNRYNDSNRRRSRGRNWVLIEDISECFGNRFNGQLLGTIGDFGAASMYANKTVTAGDGGFVIAKDPLHASRLHSLVNHGFVPGYHFVHFERCMDLKMNGLGASLALAAIRHIDEVIAHRSQLASWYRQGLRNLEGAVSCMPRASDDDTPWVFGIECCCGAVKEDLRRYLAEKCAIETRNYFPPLHRQPAYFHPQTSQQQVNNRNHITFDVIENSPDGPQERPEEGYNNPLSSHISVTPRSKSINPTACCDGLPERQCESCRLGVADSQFRSSTTLYERGLYLPTHFFLTQTDVQAICRCVRSYFLSRSPSSHSMIQHHEHCLNFSDYKLNDSFTSSSALPQAVILPSISSTSVATTAIPTSTNGTSILSTVDRMGDNHQADKEDRVNLVFGLVPPPPVLVIDQATGDLVLKGVAGADSQISSTHINNNIAAVQAVVALQLARECFGEEREHPGVCTSLRSRLLKILGSATTSLRSSTGVDYRGIEAGAGYVHPVVKMKLEIYLKFVEYVISSREQQQQQQDAVLSDDSNITNKNDSDRFSIINRNVLIIDENYSETYTYADNYNNNDASSSNNDDDDSHYNSINSNSHTNPPPASQPAKSISLLPLRMIANHPSTTELSLQQLLHHIITTHKHISHVMEIGCFLGGTTGYLIHALRRNRQMCNGQQSNVQMCNGRVYSRLDNPYVTAVDSFVWDGAYNSLPVIPEELQSSHGKDFFGLFEGHIRSVLTDCRNDDTDSTPTTDSDTSNNNDNNDNNNNTNTNINGERTLLLLPRVQAVRKHFDESFDSMEARYEIQNNGTLPIQQTQIQTAPIHLLYVDLESTSSYPDIISDSNWNPELDTIATETGRIEKLSGKSDSLSNAIKRLNHMWKWVKPDLIHNESIIVINGYGRDIAVCLWIMEIQKNLKPVWKPCNSHSKVFLYQQEMY